MPKILLMVLLFSLTNTGFSAAVADGSAPTPFTAEPSRLELSHDAGLLSGHGNAAILAEIFVKLGEVPGLQLEQNYSPTREDKVSFRFEDKPVRDAVKDLLRGYDYFITGSDKPGYTLKLVLLGPITPTAPVTEEQPPAPIAAAPDPVQEAEEQKAEEQEPPALRGLEDFWPLTRVQPPNPGREKEHTPDPQLSEDERAAIELQALQQRRERVERAGAALASDYRHLHQDAITDLQGVDDPQATATLQAAAVGELGSGDDLKAMSSESLWRHAADLGFADQAANQALVELTASEDVNVRRIAKRALQDMEYYLMRQEEEAQAAQAARD